MADDSSDIVLNEHGSLALVGLALHITRPDGDMRLPIPVLGALDFQNPVWVSQPPPLPSGGGLTVVAGLGGTKTPGVSGGVTFSLRTTSASAAATVAGTATGPAFTRLWAMRKSKERYPLYDALDALIEAVLELGRR